MKNGYCIMHLWTIIVVLVLAPAKCCGAAIIHKFNAIADTTTSFQSSIKSRLLERRQLNAANSKSENRKLIEVSDPTSVVDGQYIVIFDPDGVSNATETSMQLFSTSQISYVFDNIAIKGVAIRNITNQKLHELEANSHILSMEPVRRNVTTNMHNLCVLYPPNLVHLLTFMLFCMTFLELGCRDAVCYERHSI
jgi:hypothetical protein